MRLNQKNIFLLDGIGAVLSACFTGLILTRYSLFRDRITSLGKTLLAAEIIIILLVVFVEIKVYRKFKS